MKIVIDARMYGLENAGIGRYLVNLIDQIEKIDKKNDYFILLKKKYFKSLRFDNKKFKKILAHYPHYSFKEQIFLPITLFKLKPDLVHFPHFNVPIFWFGKYVVTIHDLIKHQSRGVATTTRFSLFYWLKYMVYLAVVWLVVKRAFKILTPSHFWQEELVKRYNLPKNKVIVTYEGIDKNFQLPASRDSFGMPISNFQFQKVLDKYHIKKPFVIYTGSLYPHKNVERLVEAVKIINRDDYHTTVHGSSKVLSLVIVCSRNVFYERFKKKIREMGVEKEVNLVGFVPDEELVVIYRQAEAFVFPSLLEGFGLPGLEAMAVGLPVVASNFSCLPEIYGDAARYFHPLDVNDMAEKIKEICFNDLKHRNKIIKKGFEQVKKYSWQKMAKETLRVYNVL